MKRLLPLAALIVLAAGCATMPQTEISVNSKGDWKVLSPKNTKMDGFEATKNPDGSLSVKIKSVSAVNDADAIAALATANAELGKRLAADLGTGVGAGIKASK